VSAFGYRKPSDLPETLALFPLSNALVFPRGLLTLNIFEPRYLNMIDDALAGPRLIGMIQPGAGEENEAVPELSEVGCVGRITQFTETDDGRYLITLTGVARFQLEQELEAETPYRQAIVSYDAFAEDFRISPGAGIDREYLTSSLKTYAALHGFNVDWSSVDQAPVETVIHVAAQLCPFDPVAKQALLEAVSLEDRARALIALLEWDAASDPSSNQRPLQ
jgi:Lon protease-like protein